MFQKYDFIDQNCERYHLVLCVLAGYHSLLSHGKCRLPSLIQQDSALSVFLHSVYRDKPKIPSWRRKCILYSGYLVTKTHFVFILEYFYTIMFTPTALTIIYLRSIKIFHSDTPLASYNNISDWCKKGQDRSTAVITLLMGSCGL